MTGRELVVWQPPERKVGRPTKYDPEFCERVIEFGKIGMCWEEIAAALDINYDTFWNWRKIYPEFTEATTRAKQYEYAWWLTAGREGQFQRGWNAQGWALQMRNRFGDKFRLRDVDPTEAREPVNSEVLREQIDSKLSRIADANRARDVSQEPINSGA